MSLLDRIVNDPAVCHGKPTIRGTRVLVSVIIDNLAAGVSEESILKNYPSLHMDDVRAVVQYSAMLARADVIPTPPRPAAHAP
jgi:uncharacterized protein (DUF433 family)